MDNREFLPGEQVRAYGYAVAPEKGCKKTPKPEQLGAHKKFNGDNPLNFTASFEVLWPECG